jgi:uncharacterized protein YjbI with pentapeptide repeats
MNSQSTVSKSLSIAAAYTISFTHQHWEEISKQIRIQIRIQMKQTEHADFFNLINALDEEIKVLFSTLENLSLEEQRKSIESLLPSLNQLTACSMNQNCHIKLKQFIEAGSKVKDELFTQFTALENQQNAQKLEQEKRAQGERENQARREMLTNAGLLAYLPSEIFLNIVCHFNVVNGKDLIALANTSRYLSILATAILYDPACLLHYLIPMPARDILTFKKRFFRPIDCDLYQSLKQKALSLEKIHTENDYKILFCYALLTNNITELNQENINQLLSYVKKEKKYHDFVPCINGISLYLEGNHQELYKLLGSDGNLFHLCFDKDTFLIDHHYMNYASAFFKNFSKHENSLLRNQFLDLRFSNLENTVWIGSRGEENYFSFLRLNSFCFGANFSGANLENAIFKNSALSHDCIFFRTKGKNISFECSTFDSVSFTESYLEGANFNKLIDRDNYKKLHSAIRFDDCNLDNASIIESDLNYFYFNRCDLGKTNFFAIIDFASTDSLKCKLSNLENMLRVKIEKEGNKQYIETLRHAFAKNIVRIIEDLAITSQEKLDLLNISIEQPIFEDGYKQFRQFQTYIYSFFFEESQAQKSDSQKIFMPLIKELEAQQSCANKNNL